MRRLVTTGTIDIYFYAHKTVMRIKINIKKQLTSKGENIL